MTDGCDELVAVVEGSQVGQARRTAARIAEDLDLSEEHRSHVAIIATELATNLVRYGKDGRFFVRAVRRDDGRWVQMVAVDSGPGIADVAHSMQDGVSTGGTPGTGLGAVRRLSREFDIHTTVGRGTVVLSCVGPRRTSPPARAFEWSSLATAAPRETVSGDAWRVWERDGELAAVVIDGLGHGPMAAQAAERAAEVFDQRAATTPADFCVRAHQALSGSRGAALAMAHVSPAGRMRYAGVGNISGVLASAPDSRGLPSQNGTAGLHVGKVREMEYDWPSRGILIMHSDGLSARWSLETYPGLATRHPAVIAGALYRDCLRTRDDATVLVVKHMGRTVPS